MCQVNVLHDRTREREKQGPRDLSGSRSPVTNHTHTHTWSMQIAWQIAFLVSYTNIRDRGSRAFPRPAKPDPCLGAKSFKCLPSSSPLTWPGVRSPPPAASRRAKRLKRNERRKRQRERERESLEGCTRSIDFHSSSATTLSSRLLLLSLLLSIVPFLLCLILYPPPLAVSFHNPHLWHSMALHVTTASRDVITITQGSPDGAHRV